MAGRQLACARRSRTASARVIVDHHQVEVGSSHHLPPAGLAHQHHRQPAARRPCRSRLGVIRHHSRQQRRQRRVRQSGAGAARRRRRRSAPPSAPPPGGTPRRARCGGRWRPRPPTPARVGELARPAVAVGSDVDGVGRQQPFERRRHLRQVVGQRRAPRPARPPRASISSGRWWNSDSTCTPADSAGLSSAVGAQRRRRPARRCAARARSKPGQHGPPSACRPRGGAQRPRPACPPGAQHRRQHPLRLVQTPWRSERLGGQCGRRVSAVRARRTRPHPRRSTVPPDARSGRWRNAWRRCRSP